MLVTSHLRHNNRNQ